MNESTMSLKHLLALVQTLLIASVVSCTNHDNNTGITPGEYLMISSAGTSGLTSRDTLSIVATGDSIYLAGLDIYGYLSGNTIMFPYQIKEVPYTSSWRINGKLKLIGTDSLYGALTLKRDGVVQQLELKLKLISQHSVDTIDSANTLYFQDVQEIQLVSGPIIRAHYAVVKLDQDSLTGYLGVFAQGSKVYVLKGIRSRKGKYNGTFSSIGPKNTTHFQNKFDLRIENARLKIRGHFPFIFTTELLQTTNKPELLVDYTL